MGRFLVAVLAASVSFLGSPHADAARVCFGAARCSGGGGTSTPTISIRNDSSREGDFNEGSDIRKLRFRVVLSGASNETVRVRFATAPDTADPSDYNEKSGRISFPPGATLRKVVVVIVGDTTVEPDETLFVRLSKPVNGQLGDRRGRGTILNDDPVSPP